MSDTIAAVSTPLGEGGIGIIRISGSQAIEIAGVVLELPAGASLADALSRQMMLCYAVNPRSRERLDQVLVSVMRAPHTYTREDVVEINCHGGIVATQEVLRAVLEGGARPAEPGEFTKRAFLNGRIDLTQAEAVIDVIRARTKESMKVAAGQLQGRLFEKVRGIRESVLEVLVQLEAAVDFSDEDLETMPREWAEERIGGAIGELKRLIESADVGRVYREGVEVAIAGRPNVGKSSLLNALLKETRAIVTAMPGTTRDIIEETVNIGGVPFRVRDTAGIREPNDEAEKIGVEMSRKAMGSADIVLVVLDVSEALQAADHQILAHTEEARRIIVLNKTDLPRIMTGEESEGLPEKQVEISATGELGLEALGEAMLEIVLGGAVRRDGEVIVSRTRHKIAMERAKEDLEEALDGAKRGVPEEFVAETIMRDVVLESLGEITGERVENEVLERIFEEFCVGK